MKNSEYFKNYSTLQDHFNSLDKACEEGKVDEVKKIVLDLDIRNLRRAETPAEVMLTNMITVETYWNALHIALFNGKLDIVKFLLEDCRIDSSSVGRLSSDKFNTDRSVNADFEAFPLYLTIQQDHFECFKYLWIDHGYFWDHTHIIGCVKLIEDINDHKRTQNYLDLLLNSKTSHEVFNFLQIDEKVEFIQFFDNPEHHGRKKYLPILKKKPFAWAYIVYKSQNLKRLQEKELKEIAKIADKIAKEDIEVPKFDQRSKTSKVDHMMVSLSKLEQNDDEKFGNVRSVTKKLVSKDELEKYKAQDEDGDRLLTEIDEVDGDDEGEGEGDQESTDNEDNELPDGETFCTYAEEGKLKQVKQAMEHKEFIDISVMTGYEKDVTIGDDEHNTELWNALLFAIHAGQQEVVSYMLSSKKLNLITALMNPEVKEKEIDENGNIDYEHIDSLFGFNIAIANKNAKMLETLWEGSKDILTDTDLIEVIDSLIDNEFHEGIYTILESKFTHEIFLTLKFEKRQVLLNSLAEKALIYSDDHGEEGKAILTILSTSPFCINMILATEEQLKKYISIARGNLQDNEMNYILFHNEVAAYSEKLKEFEDKKLNDTLLQYSAFNFAHFNLKVGEAIQTVMTTKCDDLDLFKNDPKFAHLGLHQNIKLDESKIPSHLKGCNWTFPSIAILIKNTALFNNLSDRYDPMLSMLFPLSQDNIKANISGKDVEFVSYLHALVQGSNDLDTLFNTLENHSSIFLFSEVYAITMMAILSGNNADLKVLNTRAVKSWFSFFNADGKKLFTCDIIILEFGYFGF